MTNIYRGGQVHVLASACATCIFRPAARPVDGARVAGMVRDTRDEPGATVPCHHTLGYLDEDAPDAAICRGWWDRFAERDPILRLAEGMGILAFDPDPTAG